MGGIALGHGLISGEWQKDALRIGYSGTILEEFSNLNAPAGNALLTGTTVPAGEIWCLHHATAIDLITPITSISLFIQLGAFIVALGVDLAPSILRDLIYNGYIILPAGASIRAFFNGTVLGDDIYLRYICTRVDIDQ